MVDGVLERHGKLDVLVNNAGGQFLSPAEAISPKGFRTVTELNVQGTWLMTHAAATRAFIPQGGGKVLSVTLSPHHGMPGMVHSGAARAAVENMMRTLAVEWARFGITTCALAAGQFATETLLTKYPQVVVENLERSIPIGRAGRRRGARLARRLPRLSGRRLRLGDDDHDRRRPRQLGRAVAAGRDRRRGRRAGRRGAAAEGLTQPGISWRIERIGAKRSPSSSTRARASSGPKTSDEEDSSSTAASSSSQPRGTDTCGRSVARSE